jgi:translation initiation factor 4G
MHECVKKLLGNVENPEEEEIESLCKLISTVGSLLDTPKARAHMDVYFSRMKELGKSNNVSSRMQFMLQVRPGFYLVCNRSLIRFSGCDRAS